MSRRRGWRASCRDLSELSAALTTSLRPLAESIERTIQPDGSLADDASPELNRIRREQERQQRLIEESLRAALRKLSGEGATQDDLITIRGERFVIPVRAELKRRVTGVIHGASSSGQTVYVEPLETIEQNNELVRLIEEEQAEIHRIFVALTRQVGGLRAEFGRRRARAGAGGQPAGAGAVCARVRLRCADFWSQSGCCSRAARHPLLEKRLRATGGQICSADAGADGRGAAAHHQRAEYRRQDGGAEDDGAAGHDGAGGNSGAGGAARAFRCSRRSWPTSAMRNRLRRRCRHSPRTSRISTGCRGWRMRDRWCCSTNWARRPIPKKARRWRWPWRRIFLRAGAWTLISTHHTSLKVYAANTPGVRNAAAGVDEKTLAPNYQFHLGVPGASAGIQTAERLGLNAAIIAGGARAAGLAAGRHCAVSRQAAQRAGAA